jgi:hypothetical protein
MENPNDQSLKVLKDQVTEYAELKSEYARLALIEGSAKVTAYFSTTIIIGALTLLFLTSLLVACSFFLGQYFHSYGMGFLVSSAIYLLLLLVFLAVWRKKSERSIINKIIQLTNGDESN